MSKYIIELDENAKKVVAISLEDGIMWTDETEVENLEELNSDYINEHFGQLQDEAYKRGFEDGKWKSEDGCTGCQYEGKVVTGQPCITRCNSYINQWTAKKQDDGIKVGDVVEWGDDLILITRLYTSGGFRWCDGFNKDGTVFHVLEENVSNGNQHFDIDKILGEMNE